MAKNILITHVHMNTGGIETSLVNMLNSLPKEIYNIDLVLYYPVGDLLNLLPSWVNVIPVWNINNANDLKLKKIILSRSIKNRIVKNILLNKHTVKKYIPNKHYDVSIAYSGYFEFTDLIAGYANADKKYIWSHADFYTQCQIDKNFRKKFKKIKANYQLFTKVICVSSFAKDNLKKLLNNKIDVDFLWNLNMLREIKKEEDIKLDGTFNIVTISRLYKYKGIERLINAAKLINKPFKLYILGDGPYMKAYRQMVIKNNLEKNVIFTGNVSNVFNVLKQADLYVSASDAEGLSNVIIESLISKVPVISTPTSGAKEIFTYIAPKESVKLADDFNYKSLANAINTSNLTKSFTFNIENINKKILDKLENELLN